MSHAGNNCLINIEGSRELAISRYRLLPDVCPLSQFSMFILAMYEDKEKISETVQLPLWLINYQKIGMKAFGHYLVPNSAVLELAHESFCPEPSNMKNRPIPLKNPDFKIIERIGKRTYTALNVKTGGLYWTKIDHESRTKYYSDFHFFKEWFALLCYSEQVINHRSHVLPFKAMYYHPKLKCRLFFKPLVDNLADLIKVVGDLSEPTAYYLSFETLEAVHDVHIHDIIHRDIRPSNFLVGRGKNYRLIYIIGFTACVLPRKMQKNKNTMEEIKDPCKSHIRFKSRYFDWRFTPRVYHTCSEYKFIDDVESWLFMMIYFFKRELLPWHSFNPNCWDLVDKNNIPTNEAEVVNIKNRFFTGFYDANFSFPLRDCVQTIRCFFEMNHTHSQNGFLDYGFLFYQLFRMKKHFAWSTDRPDKLLDWIGIDDNVPNKVLPKDKRFKVMKLGERKQPLFMPATHQTTTTVASNVEEKLKAKFTDVKKTSQNIIVTPTNASEVVNENVNIKKVNSFDEETILQSFSLKEGATQEVEDKDEHPANALPSFSTKRSDEKTGGGNNEKKSSHINKKS